MIRLLDDIDKFIIAGRPVSDLRPLLSLLREQVEGLQMVSAEMAAVPTDRDLPGFEQAYGQLS